MRVLFTSTFAAALFLSGSATLGAADVIGVGHGEATPGTRNVRVAVTGRHDLPIHGFSLAIVYPPTVLRLLSISPQGTSIGESAVEFFQEELNHSQGTATLAAIFDFLVPYELAELPATRAGDLPQVLAWLTFDVLPGALPGEYPIRLVDGVGDPPISNRYTHRGTTIRPRLEEGTFAIVSENVLTLDSKLGAPGFRVGALYAYARHPEPLQGFQVAVSFDPRALELTDATVSGTVMLSEVGGLSKIEFLNIRWQAQDICLSPTECRTTAGVVFDYLEPIDESRVLPPETGSNTRQSIMKYAFQVKDGADQFGESITLSLADSGHPDTLNNIFIIDRQGYPPRKVDGWIYFSTGYLAGKVEDYKTRQAIPGAAVVAEPGGYASTSRPDGTFLIGGPEGVPPGPYSITVSKSGYLPGRARGEVAGKSATTELASVFLFPAPKGTGGFRRAMLNPDSTTDISDGIVLLGFLFHGLEVPACMDAADSNDDGLVDLTDAIFIFSYLFMAGTPPASPFVNCGPDPTADPLDCASFPGC